jgi:hypothetical protein
VSGIYKTLLEKKDEIRELLIKLMLEKNKNIIEAAKDMGMCRQTLSRFIHGKEVDFRRMHLIMDYCKKHGY